MSQKCDVFIQLSLSRSQLNIYNYLFYGMRTRNTHTHDVSCISSRTDCMTEHFSRICCDIQINYCSTLAFWYDIGFISNADKCQSLNVTSRSIGMNGEFPVFPLENWNVGNLEDYYISHEFCFVLFTFTYAQHI